MSICAIKKELNDKKIEQKSLSNQMEINLENLSTHIVEQLSAYDSAISIIKTNISILDLEDMPSWNDMACEIRKVDVEFGDFVYKISFYNSQISFHIYKNDVRIGALYYWDKNNTSRPLKLHYDLRQSVNVDLYGLNETTIADYMLAAKELTENMDIIFKQASNMFLDNLSQKISELEELYNNVSSEITELEKNVNKDKQKYEQLF